MMSGRVLIQRATHNAQNLYFSLRRATAQDTRLSFEARGMLIYLLSKPDDWQLQIADLMREGVLGRNRVYRLIKELIEARYIARTFTRDDKKHVQGVIYLVYEEPYTGNQETANLFTGNQETGKLETGNQDLGFGDNIQNRESDKKEILLQSIEGERGARARTEKPEVRSIEEETGRGLDSPMQEDSTSPTPPGSAEPPPPPAVLYGLGMVGPAKIAQEEEAAKAFRAIKATPLYQAFETAWKATLPPGKHDVLIPELKPSDVLKYQTALEHLKLMSATPEQVRKVVTAKRAAGKAKYWFYWLPDDVKELQIKEADAAVHAPAAPAAPASRPATPAQPGRTPAPVVRLQDAKKLPVKEEDKSA